MCLNEEKRNKYVLGLVFPWLPVDCQLCVCVLLTLNEMKC